MTSLRKRAMVLGGAGFVGSAIVRGFAEQGWAVDVIDSIEPRTFGDPARIAALGGVSLDRRDVAAIGGLAERLGQQDVVVDAIGWTRHRDAEAAPELDLRLNLAVHLHLLQQLRPGPLLVWLGSRHQFAGRGGVIDDDAGFAPLDVQGIHKCAAEQHVARWARQTGGRAVALRIGNCLGPGQPVDDGDVGLIGGFLRDLGRGETISVFDGPRVRNICFTADVASVVVGLAGLGTTGYVPVNMAGIEVDIGDLAAALRTAVGRGSLCREPMPPEIARMELESGTFIGPRLQGLLPEFRPAALGVAAAKTAASLMAP